MCVDLKNLSATTNNCGGNLGGLLSKIFVAKADDIESIPEPAASPANQKVIAADIVMKTGKVFREWNFQKDTGKADSNSVGNTGSKSFEDFVEGIMPRQARDVMEQLFHNINTEFVVIARTRNGDNILIGDLDNPAYFEEVKATTGLKGSDPANVMFKFKAESKNGYKFYDGAILLTV